MLRLLAVGLSFGVVFYSHIYVVNDTGNLAVRVEEFLASLRSNPQFPMPSVQDYFKLFWVAMVFCIVNLYLLKKITLYSAKEYEALARSLNGSIAKNYKEFMAKQNLIFEEISEKFIEKCTWKYFMGSVIFVSAGCMAKFLMFDKFQMLLFVPLSSTGVAISALIDTYNFIVHPKYERYYNSYRLKFIKVSMGFLILSYFYDIHMTALALQSEDELLLNCAFFLFTQLVYTSFTTELGALRKMKEMFIVYSMGKNKKKGGEEKEHH